MPRSRGTNDRAKAERLGRQRQVIETVRTDAEAAALIARRGYTAEAFDAGLALHADALRAYGRQDAAVGARKAAGQALAAANRTARRRLSELRRTLRAHYAGQPEHLATLGVTRERLATDRDTFFSESRATLAAVRNAPYAAVAADAGQDEAALDAAGAALDALARAVTAYAAAHGGRKASTAARDAAYRAFQTWMARFRRLARLAFRDHPDVAARVGF